MSFMRSTRAEFAQHWRVVPFEEAIEDATGGNAKVQTRDYRESGRLPVIDQGQAEVAGYVGDMALACRAPLPCILFGDHTRILKYVTAPFALGADGVKVLVPQKHLDARFVYHYLQTVRLPDDLGYSRHFKYLRESVVPVPPLAEQRRIAYILDKADAIRRKRKEAIALTEELLRSAFLEMFGDPVTNPKGWPVRSVADLCESRQYGTADKANESRDGLPVLRMNNLTYSGEIDLTDLKWVRLSENEQSKLDLRDGDVLFNRVNSHELVGKTAVWHHGEGYTFAGYLIRLRLGSDAIGDYLSAAMNMRSMKRVLMNMAKPSINMANISGSDLTRVNIPVPPIADQARFKEFRRHVYDSRGTLGSHAREAETLFHSLVSRAFSGELSI